MLYTITKKPKTPNMLWDGQSKTIIVKFDEKGVFVTKEKALAEKLKALGHTVAEEEEPANVAEMTVEQLKEYAAAHNIDLGKAKTKADILAVLK